MIPAFLAAALPALIAAGAGAAGNIAAGAIGNAAAGSEREKQAAMLAQILSEYSNIPLPELKNMVAEQMGPSAQESVRGQMDPRLRNEQDSVLAGLRQLENTGGENAETRATMSRILGDVARQEGAGRNAILSGMRARGVSGSGAELAAQLSNNQAAAERAQTAGLEQGAAAQRRMLDAMLQRGNMAGQMRGQDYRELSDAARARDMIAQYNADSRSKAGYYNASLPQQQFQNRLTIANGKAGAMSGQAQMAGQSADRTAAMWGGIGSGINQAAQGVAGSFQQEQAKKDYLDALAKAGGK